MPQSVLFDARLVLDKPTGIGRYISSLVPELLRLAPDLHFHLLRRPDPWPGYDLDSWQAPNLSHHISTLPHMALRQHLQLPRLAKNLEVDLLHYPHFDAPVLFSSIPVVATLYDAKYIVRPDFFTQLNRLKRVYMRLCYAQTLRRAAAVITISKATAIDLQRIFKVDQSHIVPIHLAAAAEFQPVSKKKIIDLKRKYSLERPFILSVSERRPHKNFVGLITAYAQSHSRDKYDLVIIGQSYQDYSEPEAIVAKLQMSDHVRFLENVGAADLVAFYNAADLFVLVSFYEGFALPVLEAMACGTPVIASRTTATGEITGDGGIRVDPDNITEIAQAIDFILTDDDIRHRQVARGSEWYKRFSWQQTAQKTLNVYQQILGKSA